MRLDLDAGLAQAGQSAASKFVGTAVFAAIEDHGLGHQKFEALERARA